MQIAFNYSVIVFGTAIVIGLFTSIVVYFQRANQPANRFLSLLLLTSALWLLGFFFGVAGIYEQNPNYYFKPIFYSFAFGPLIYCYVKHLVNRRAVFTKRDLIHFIPVLFQTGLYWFLTFQPYDYRRWFWFDVHRPITQRIEFIGTFLSLFIYLLLSVRLLKHYQTWLKENTSETSRVNLNWLKVLLAIIFVWSGQWLLEIVLREVFNSYYEYDFAAFILTVLIVVTALGSVWQTEIVALEVAEAPMQKPTVDQEILEKIVREMGIGKYYLYPQLSLKVFAKEIGLPSRTVSEHLNHGLNISFIDFVNEHRVTEVKRRLDNGEGERYTILGIALEAGFNSKATFHRVFKQFTGVPPGEYLEKTS